jgi:hypothetical protein
VLATWIGAPGDSHAEAIEACPVLKVKIGEIPAAFKLRLRPSLGSDSHMPMKTDYTNPIKLEQGINIDVLWQNKTSQPLRGLVLRLEYQQAKTSAFRVIEQHIREAAPGGHWTEFQLRGGEFEDTQHIAAWRVTVVSAGQVLGDKRSAMWR